MKGVLLAGGLGSRLLPMTRVTNKHLLPVYDRPMIYFPLQQLVHAGIRDILVVTGGDHAGDFLKLLRNGHDFGLGHLRYAYQEGEGGIAEALGLAEHFAAGEPLAVILGDNIFQDSLAEPIARFRDDPDGAKILLKEVHDPERFGVATVEGDQVTRIVEKPARPESRLAVTGCYLYDPRVFEVIRELEPSGRGELEITDVNNRYVEWGALRHHVVSGWWADAGTVGSLHRATGLVAADRENPVLTDLGIDGGTDRAQPPAATH
ncbi:MAG: NTP transferase domain-containing protein [Gemmatimonadetes bacterium]|nr:NTP transferase domain-containing protein [Gemmatimonadota bacterium]